MNVCGKEVRVQGRLLRIARLDLEKYESLRAPVAIVDALRGQGVDLFTFLQTLSNDGRTYPYPSQSDNFAVLPVSTFDHWWTKQIDNKTRNMVRRAEKKGLAAREVVFDDQLVQGIWRIYNETPIRQGKRFPHYGKDLQAVHDEEATYLDRSIFISAFVGEQLVGFIKLVTSEDRTQAGIMNIVSLIEQRDKAPTNALVAEAVRACAARGISSLVYSNFAYGKKDRDTLADFKRNNGFQRVDIRRYYVPLTAFGKVALRLGLQRKFVDHLPAPLLAKMRDFRQAWYQRRLRSITQTS